MTTVLASQDHTLLSANEATLSKIYQRISWRILPLLLICYVFAYLDRVNIGFAKLGMQQDIGFSDAVYGLGAGIFFIGYFIFEVPSNLWLVRIGVRKTISRIMVLWGLTSTAMVLVSDPISFYTLRFFLGVFEAGFAPGMILYLTYWYPQARRARVMAIVLLAGPVANIFGGPLSSWILSNLNGMHGYAGWKWMFFLEGAPCILIGIFVFFYLVDSPNHAAWLSNSEREIILRQLDSPSNERSHTFIKALRDPRIYILSLTYFCLICGLYTVSFWLPTMLKEAGINNVMHIGLYSALPYLGAVAAMVLNARSSDRHQERRWHGALPAFAAASGLTLTAMSTASLTLALSGIIIATISCYAAYAVFWPRPTAYLKGTAMAGGVAFINSIGALGGFVSPAIIGALRTFTGSLQSGLLAMASLLVLGAFTILWIRLPQHNT